MIVRLNLGRRLVNLLPVAQRTTSNALTNGVVDRPWVVGREFESHVHHENAFLRKVIFSHVKNLIKHCPWAPRDFKNFGLGTYGPIRRPSIPLFRRRGECFKA